MFKKIFAPKETPVVGGLSQLLIGLGWRSNRDDFDLDASCFLLGANGKARRQEDCVFFNQLATPCGSVVHRGDSETGAPSGDAEQIEVDLRKLPSDVAKLVFAVSIYEAEFKDQNFSMADAVYVRVVDLTTGEEIVRFNLADDAGRERTVIFGELAPQNNEWRFRPLGQGFDGALPELAEQFGLVVDRDELDEAARSRASQA